MVNSLSDHILVVVLPLVISNTLHMVLVRFSWLKALNKPVSEKYFGKNKTWRGFAFLIVVNALLVFIIVRLFGLNFKNAAALGAFLGFTYLLFELPNSWMKRKLGVGPGEKHRRYRYFFSWLDKSDSAFGLSLVYLLMGYVNGKMAVMLFIVCSATHVVSSLMLVGLKIKSSF